MSQSAFGDYVGVSRECVTLWEAGKHRPNMLAQRMLSILARFEDIQSRSEDRADDR
jgi:DNA-binding transcriptional regulator YiaG